jgi:hypothetical protein
MRCKAALARSARTAQAVREQHGRDEGSLQAPPPSAVVFAESTQDVADAVKLASQYDVPVIPYGVGSSLEGHLLAVQGGISIDVSRMNRVLSINADDLTVTVQPGITRKQAQRSHQGHRPVLSHRPRRRRQHWRHERHARQRHQRRALRHHARKRAGARSGHRQRRGHPHRHARQKQRGLRPHAPDGGQRRHAGRDHRSDGAPVPAA